MSAEQKKQHHTPRNLFFTQSPWLQLLRYTLFSVGLFFYYWLYVQPEYIYFLQQPVFFIDRLFILERLQLPGGVLDYIALYLTSLFQFGWLGAVILAALALVSYMLIDAVLRPRSLWLAPLLPVVFLVMIQSDYDYPVVKTLSFILALEGFVLYRDAFPQNGIVRFGLAIASMVMLYILSPSSMLLFALLCGVYEALGRGQKIIARISLPLGYVSLAAVLPWLFRKELFLLPLQTAYIRHSPLWQADHLPMLTFADVPLDGVLIVLMVLFAGIAFVPKIEKDTANRRINQRMVLQAAIAVILFVYGGWNAIDAGTKEFLEIRYAAHNGDWKTVLTYLNPRTAQYKVHLFHFNRALCHTGRMGSDFFSIPQNFVSKNLFLDKDTKTYCPLDYSDFFFELGHINEAKRWASEALTLHGESPEVLKRLVLVNILKEEYAAASLYLNRLRQNPFSRSWAVHYESCIADPAKLRAEKTLQRLHALMPVDDFIVMTNNPEMDLAKMLKQSPGNRMACEYLMMSYLASGDLMPFVRTLDRFRALIPGELPRHYQEALLIYLDQRKATDESALKFGISAATLNDFRNFKKRFAEHQGNVKTAYADLQRSYGNTYWFYLVFYFSKS